MKYLFRLIILVIGISGCQQVKEKSTEKREVPKLVVGIVVDQMKDEYLRRFQHNFSENGFNRLMREGYVCRNTNYNYVPTYTGPGHASIYTGTVPSEHGIVANRWYNRAKSEIVYCVSDSLVTPLGTNKNAGKMSPRNLIANTIGDELKLVSNMRSKVIGVSIKDRGAILPAGHMADAAYWFEGDSGHWISSDYYFNKLPAWVEEYNNSKIVDDFLSTQWELTLSPEKYHSSLPDDNPYEGNLKMEGEPVFPYDLSEISKKRGKGVIKSTPFGNSLVIDFAQEAIIQESLGQDEFTDFIAISFSSTDYIGHLFGPNSVEVEDTYVKLDREIMEFFNVLDREVGKENYILFLTSDHGVSPSPLYMNDLGLSSGHYSEAQMKEELNNWLLQEFGMKQAISRIENLNIYLNQAVLNNKAQKKEIINSIKQKVMEYEWVKDIYDANHLHKQVNTKSGRLIANGFWKKRSGDLIIQTRPYWLSDGHSNTGSSHGSAYGYDTHVPLIWYGAGIPKGEDFSDISITDIAPTLSFLINSNPPNSSSGKVINGIFKK